MAGSGRHYEHCPEFQPETEDLYRLTKACPTCSIPEDHPCHSCHHPKGLHDKTACAYFLSCSCTEYTPLECRFGCRDGRVIPDRVYAILRWFFPSLIRDIELDDLIYSLDQEAQIHYPLWPDHPHKEYVHVKQVK